MSYPADIEWNLTPGRVAGGISYYSDDQVTQAILMDIRRELKKLNSLLGCRNFTEIPTTLRAIRRNTTKPRKRKSTKGNQP